MAKIFSTWNKGELDSYLIEITADILAYKESDGSHLIDKILDTAGQKGTGKWTVNASLDAGVPLTLIAESVFSRFLSSQKDERVIASKLYPKLKLETIKDKKGFIFEDLRKALYGAKILSLHSRIRTHESFAKDYNWNLNYGGIALMWRSGCIIRSAFLDKIKAAFEINPSLNNLLLDAYFEKTIKAVLPSMRKVIATAIMNGIPVPTLSSALSYFDGYTTDRLPANLLQAQRDFLELTLMKELIKIKKEVSSSIPTGLEKVETHLLLHITYNENHHEILVMIFLILSNFIYLFFCFKSALFNINGEFVIVATTGAIKLTGTIIQITGQY